MVTRDGGVPLLSHAYPGNKPDVTQFAQMITALAARHRDDGRLRRRAELRSQGEGLEAWSQTVGDHLTSLTE